MSKFIQITSSVSSEGENTGAMEYLYALDNEGIVWYYDFDDNEWTQLSNGRSDINILGKNISPLKNE
jgi:hypothetical protein